MAAALPGAALPVTQYPAGQWSILAFAASVGINAVLTNMAAVADQLANTSVNNIFSVGNNFYGAYAAGATMTRAQFTSPTLRKIAPWELDPVDVSATVTSPPPFVDYLDNPLPSAIGEVINFAQTGTAAEAEMAGIWVGNVLAPPPTGPVYSTRATATATLTTTTWVSSALTMDQSLPAGYYTVVGFHARSASGGLARLIFPGQYHRPGAVMTAGFGKLDAIDVRSRKRIVFGSFAWNAVPSVEMLGRAADAAETFVLDVVQVKAGA